MKDYERKVIDEIGKLYPNMENIFILELWGRFSETKLAGFIGWEERFNEEFKEFYQKERAKYL